MAAASGLSLLTTDERDPIRATSIGTGDLIRAALNARVSSIVLGIGGSATTDGGAGLLTGLGARADRDTATVDLADLDPRLATVELQVACDVSNPLCGPTGAAAVYGPQKGATPDDVQDLDRRLGRFADSMELVGGRPERTTPGAGAAGGVGYALLSIQDRFRSFGLRPGVDLVMDATDFDARLARADLVITGEGRIDSQTAFGKTALGVARRAQAAGVPCIAVGGGVEPDGIAALAEVGAVAVPVTERPQSVEEAMAAGTAPLERCGERIARSSVSERRSHDRRGSARAASSTPAPKPKRRPRPKKRKFSDPGRSFAKRLERYRPGLVPFVLDGLASKYGRPTWERRLDPTSELILTILTQSTADTNAEAAFEALRRAYPGGGPVEAHKPGAGWGGFGLPDGAAPDWARVEFAPTPRTDRRHPSGRPAQPEGAAPPDDPAQDPRGARRLLPRVPRRHAGDRGARLAGRRSMASARRPPRCCCCSASASRCCRSTATSTASCAGSACCHRSPRSMRRTTWSSGCSSPTRCTRPTSTSSSTAARSATPSAPSTTSARCGRAAATWTRRRPSSSGQSERPAPGSVGTGLCARSE